MLFLYHLIAASVGAGALVWLGLMSLSPNGYETEAEFVAVAFGLVVLIGLGSVWCGSALGEITIAGGLIMVVVYTTDRGEKMRFETYWFLWSQWRRLVASRRFLLGSY
ncbi:MAG: hypothetical protein Q7S66_02590 [bacterium]|nr:hypothetical protein [bacterium]